MDVLTDDNRLISASDAFVAAATTPKDAYEPIVDRLSFWENQAKKLHWFKPWRSVLEWNCPIAKWFDGGRLNACHNCLDVHLDTPIEDKPALIWEGELGAVRSIAYWELHDWVSRFAAALSDHYGISRGDRVTIYMPLIPEAVVAMLACARIGAIHSVVFGGFSAQSLRDRVADSQSALVITADGGYRRGQAIQLKSIVDEALGESDIPVVVVTHTGAPVTLRSQDALYERLLDAYPEGIDSTPMDSEDPLFILYTSGTTGKPKGIVHTTGGYLTHARYSTQLVFDLKPNDVYWCTADIGWITGHTYVVYGPLANGATVLIYEGAPDFPSQDRFWQLIAKHKVSVFYTAPTAIRAFMKWGHALPGAHDLSSLRILGSVGEPINPEAWLWYYSVIGGGRCPIVDTWWQTETGGIMIATLPALAPMRPGYAGRPLPGIDVAVLSEETGESVQSGGGLLSIMTPWPSMARGIWGDLDRFKSTYWSRFDTYFAGDGAAVDADGNVMVLGRVDDVLNVAGHRIGTMEVESAIVDYDGVAEAAVVGVADEIKGQAILAFVTLKNGVSPSHEMAQAITQWVARSIGAIARPSRVVFTPDLPKTRSGKIMRRVLKSIVNHQPVGDVTTLANPDIVLALKTALDTV